VSKISLSCTFAGVRFYISIYILLIFINLFVEGDITPSTAVLTWAELESKFLNLQAGGRYRPRNCTSHHRVAIIVPFRDRDIYLKIFLNNIHPLLQRQQLDYGIYIVDLVSEKKTPLGFTPFLLLVEFLLFEHYFFCFN
jgi:hypothetical protein